MEDGTSEGERKMMQGGHNKKKHTYSIWYNHNKAPSLEVEERAEARAERAVKNEAKESPSEQPSDSAPARLV